MLQYTQAQALTCALVASVTRVTSEGDNLPPSGGWAAGGATHSIRSSNTSHTLTQPLNCQPFALCSLLAEIN